MPDAHSAIRGRRRECLFNDRTLGGLLLVVGLFNAVLAFLITLNDCLRYPGVDLRCKVVAARAIVRGLDPYRFKWQEGMSDELLDPLKRHPGPSRATYPPTLLAMYVPLARLPYPVQRIAWFFLEWTALVASLALLAGPLRSRLARTALLAVGLFFFAAGDIWRFHVERGQFYVFVLLLLSMGTRCLVRGASNDWLAGHCFGLATTLRPTFAIMVIPLVLLGFRKSAVAMVATSAVAVALTLPFVGVQGWASYAATVRVYEEIVVSPDLGAEFLARTYGPAHPVPREAEGRELVSSLPIAGRPSTLLDNFAAFHASMLRRAASPSLATVARGSLVAFTLAVGTLAVAMRRRKRRVSGRFVAAFATIAVIDIEYFLPIRQSYADVLFLQPLAVLMPALIRCEALKFARTAVLAGLVLGQHQIIMSDLTGVFVYFLIASGLTIAVVQMAIGRDGRTSGIQATVSATDPLSRSGQELATR